MVKIIGKVRCHLAGVIFGPESDMITGYLTVFFRRNPDMTCRRSCVSAKLVAVKYRTGVLLVFLTFLLSGCSLIPVQSGTTAAASSTGTASPAATATTDFFAMDTYMSITANGTYAQAAVDAAQAEVYVLENELSRNLPASEISKINAQSGLGPVT